MVCPLLGACRGCSHEKPESSEKDKRSFIPDLPLPAASEERLELGWNPSDGKGDVRHRLASGDILRTCFHCGFAGYTGGLFIGSLSGSGMGFYPRTPIRGYSSINVFCAQDESIWDQGEKAEYSFGWSENFGTGADGKRLEYRRGRVLEQDRNRLVLQSENSGGCYRVTRVAATRLGTRYFILATRIHNTCKRPVRFDFWSGDDPWIGLYRSSDGDVGWTPDGLVRTEASYGPGEFTAGGLYDLGNAALGQKEGGFSGQANFFLLDPATPLPDKTYFANRFAHGPDEIDPKKPLDNKTLTALNMGWTDRVLKPGQGFTVAMALGLAEVPTVGEVPRLPVVSAEDWSLWRPYLEEGNPGPDGGVEFAAERVELDLSPGQLLVDGLYTLRNRSDAATGLAIRYPIITGPGRSSPSAVEADGAMVPVAIPVGNGHPAAHFSVEVPPRGLRQFRVRYTQAHQGRKAAYMVTSALAWSTPIDRAVFVIRHPRSMGTVRVSYPVSRRKVLADRVELLVVQQPFRPDREVEMTW